MKKLLIIAHTPSDNTYNMLQALLAGARYTDDEDAAKIEVTWIEPLKANLF